MDLESAGPLLRPDELSHEVVGSAIEVHRHLGPGLLESAYEECLAHELTIRGMSIGRQVPVPIHYKDVRLDAGYRLDIVVNQAIIIEIKSVEKTLPVHDAQLLTYLRLTKIRIGLLMNFNVPVLKDGLRRLVL